MFEKIYCWFYAIMMIPGIICGVLISLALLAILFMMIYGVLYHLVEIIFGA